MTAFQLRFWLLQRRHFHLEEPRNCDQDGDLDKCSLCDGSSAKYSCWFQQLMPNPGGYQGISHHTAKRRDLCGALDIVRPPRLVSCLHGATLLLLISVLLLTI